MNEFYKALTHVNKIFYEPNHLTIHDIQEEAQNSEYGPVGFNCIQNQFDSESQK